MSCLDAARTTALSRSLTPRLTPYIPIAPSPKQAAFLLLSQVREVMYGGAAGGGKSWAILAAALQYVDVPGYNALILRRTYKDLALPDAIMDVSHQWLAATDAHWTGTDYAWVFPSGARLVFGYLDKMNDMYRYQSAAFHFIGFDELSHFAERQYRYMFSRLRRRREGPAAGIPLRMRSGTNPGGEGHEWVRARFIQPWREGKLPANRAFVPARLEDNAHLDYDDYVESLQELDAITRRQLLRGDWDARNPGGQFDRAWIIDRDQIIDRGELPVEGLRFVRFWDLAATKQKQGRARDPDWTAGLLMALHQATGQYYLVDVVRFRESPGETEKRILRQAKEDGRGVAIRMEQEGGASGKHVISSFASKLRGYDFRGVRPDGPKAERARPVSAAWFNGKVWIVRGAWNSAFWDEVEAFPDTTHDDQVDAMSGAHSVLSFIDQKHQPGWAPGRQIISGAANPIGGASSKRRGGRR